MTIGRHPEYLTTSSVVVRRAGAVCWALLGVVAVAAVVVAALSAVSEVFLPLLLAVVLAVLFSPMARWLRGWLPPSAASLSVVVLLVGAVALAVVIAIAAVVDQADVWSRHLDAALAEVEPSTSSVGVDEEKLERARTAVEGAAGLIAGGFVTLLVSGVDAVIGFVAGAVLGVLILYYLLKDTETIRTRVVDWFGADARPDVDALVSRSTAMIRAYGLGRAILSLVVAAVVTVWSMVIGLPMLSAIAIVNFLGGFIPYIGAVVGGGIAVVLALSEVGIGGAAATLAVILVANLAVENLVEPRVMASRLHIHPLAVLVVTTAGGIVGGIVGLMLAVPMFVFGMDALRTARRRVTTPQG